LPILKPPSGEPSLFGLAGRVNVLLKRFFVLFRTSGPSTAYDYVIMVDPG
jgi:hypothetical protein